MVLGESSRPRIDGDPSRRPVRGPPTRLPAHVRRGARPSPPGARAAPALVRRPARARDAKGVRCPLDAIPPRHHHRRLAGHHADQRLALRARLPACGAALDPRDSGGKRAPPRRIRHRRPLAPVDVAGDAACLGHRGPLLDVARRRAGRIVPRHGPGGGLRKRERRGSGAGHGDPRRSHRRVPGASVLAMGRGRHRRRNGVVPRPTAPGAPRLAHPPRGRMDRARPDRSVDARRRVDPSPARHDAGRRRRIRDPRPGRPALHAVRRRLKLDRSLRTVHRPSGARRSRHRRARCRHRQPSRPRPLLGGSDARPRRQGARADRHRTGHRLRGRGAGRRNGAPAAQRSGFRHPRDRRQGG